MVKSFSVFTIGMILLLGGCSPDAPHDNPLDPQSPKYTGTGSIAGRITMLNFENAGIEGAVLTTVPPTLQVVSDSSGNYHFPALADGSYLVIASKSTFSPDTAAVTVQTGHELIINLVMNAAPVVASTKILTQKIDQWWPNPVYSALVTADVTDANGIADIDSVWFRVDSLKFPMSYSVDARDFEVSINSYQLPSNNIEYLVGKPLTVIARDRSNAAGAGASFYVSRVIEDEATPDYPKFSDTTGASPLLQWTAPNVRFFYTYTINVVRMDAGTQVVVWTQTAIASYLTSFQYPSALDPGNYFWTIAVADEYGNFSRSKESSFVVN